MSCSFSSFTRYELGNRTITLCDVSLNLLSYEVMMVLDRHACISRMWNFVTFICAENDRVLVISRISDSGT